MPVIGSLSLSSFYNAWSIVRAMAGPKDVDALVSGLDPKRSAAANKLRVLMKQTLPEVVETVKWGNPTYLLRGKNLAMIMLGYGDRINFGFWAGAKLSSKLLEGTGKGIRHIKVWTEADIKELEFAKVIREAAKLT